MSALPPGQKDLQRAAADARHNEAVPCYALTLHETATWASNSTALGFNLEFVYTQPPSSLQHQLGHNLGLSCSGKWHVGSSREPVSCYQLCIKQRHWIMSVLSMLTGQRKQVVYNLASPKRPVTLAGNVCKQEQLQQQWWGFFGSQLFLQRSGYYIHI